MQAQYLLKQDDVAPTLKSLLQQFYKRHHKHCEISSSQMVEHLFRFILTFSFFYDRHWQNEWYWSCLLSCLCHVFVCFYWFLCCVLCPMLLVSPLLIASSILSNVYIFHENMYLQNLRSPVLHVQKSKFSLYLSFFLYKYKNNRSSKNKCIEFSPKYKYYNISIMTSFK